MLSKLASAFILLFDLFQVLLTYIFSEKCMLSIRRTDGHYYQIIGKFEVGLPLSALKEIVELALAMMPQEDAKKVVEEWCETNF